MTLLRIYLRPTDKTSSDLLQPALDLIGRHSPRLDPVETLQLLPPLVTAQDVRTFLIEALRTPIFDTHVIREINKARNDQVARKLMLLETKRVKVTDSRMSAVSVVAQLVDTKVYLFTIDARNVINESVTVSLPSTLRGKIFTCYFHDGCI